jgi:outer membrane protein TolC
MLAIQARGTRDVAEAELARLVGLPPGSSLAVAGAAAAAGATQESADALLETARQQRPERAALVKRVASSNERTRAAAAGSKPAVAVAGGWDYARPNPRIFPREEAWRTSWDAGINVSWPIFDGGRTRSEIAEAAASGRALQERLAEFDTALAVEIRQRLTDVTSARAAIGAAEDAVRSATEARRVVGDRFNAGVATSTDVLDAQVALLQAELDRTQALANARLAEARLARAVGK